MSTPIIFLAAPTRPLTNVQHDATITPMAKYLALSDQLRAVIDACGLSRAEICRRIDLDPGVMSRFMAGKCGLALTTLDRLGRLFDMRLECRQPGGRKKR